MPLHAYSVCVVLTPKHKDAWRIKFAVEVLMKFGGAETDLTEIAPTLYTSISRVTVICVTDAGRLNPWSCFRSRSAKLIQ
jgi:hypothetical protein